MAKSAEVLTRGAGGDSIPQSDTIYKDPDHFHRYNDYTVRGEFEINEIEFALNGLMLKRELKAWDVPDSIYRTTELKTVPMSAPLPNSN
jgi:hypothetical protein